MGKSNSKWLLQLIYNSQQKFGNDSVSFTDAELRFDGVLT